MTIVVALQCFKFYFIFSSILKVCQGPDPQPRCQEYECAHCQKTFSEKWRIKRHLAVCRKQVETQENARREQQTFVCDYCSKEFTQRYNMQRHQEGCTHRPLPQHPQHKMMTCRQCGEKFQVCVSENSLLSFVPPSSIANQLYIREIIDSTILIIIILFFSV